MEQKRGLVENLSKEQLEAQILLSPPHPPTQMHTPPSTRQKLEVYFLKRKAGLRMSGKAVDRKDAMC